MYLKTLTSSYHRADKGGTIVIQTKETYRKEILRQFSDASCYSSLSGDPTVRFQDEVHAFLKQSFNESLISQNKLNFLFQKYPMRPHFYTLPKNT